MTDNSKPKLTGDYVTIPKAEYERLMQQDLYADIVGDIISSLPVDLYDLADDDPRYREYVKLTNPEWYEEMWGDSDE